MPTDPAVKPTIKKNANSERSLGSKFIMILNWVIWPCAPQVFIFKNITKKLLYWGTSRFYFLFSKELKKSFFEFIEECN